MPLGKKPSLKPGLRVWFDAMPASVLAEIDIPDKVCSVDAVWSGLKLMIRKDRR